MLALWWQAWRQGGSQEFTFSVVLLGCGLGIMKERFEMEAYRHWYFSKFPGWRAWVTLYVCWVVVRVKSDTSVASWKCIVTGCEEEVYKLPDYERLVRTEKSADICVINVEVL
jgi:hypothetical protein